MVDCGFIAAVFAMVSLSARAEWRRIASTMPKMRIALLILAASSAHADPLRCDLAAYQEQAGLKAQVSGDLLQLAWTGERNQELRASFAIEGGVPTIRELAARKS